MFADSLLIVLLMLALGVPALVFLFWAVKRGQFDNLDATVHPAWRIAFAAIGAVAFFTVTTRYCPLNQLIGLDTCHRKDGFS